MNDLLPAPTTDLRQARADIAEHGVCFVAGALDGGAVDRVRAALDRVAAEDRAAGRAYRYDADEANQRLWALLKRGEEFVELTVHPAALELVEHLLGRPFLLSNISANLTGPGGGRMGLHADQGYVLAPFPPEPLAANAMWLIDDFTVENGATHIVAGSHRRDHGPTVDSPPAETPLLAPAGTLCVMDGRVWHQTGENTTTDQVRRGIFAYYVRPFLRTQENWWRSLDDATIGRFGADPTLRMLLGFDHHRSLGIVDGMPLGDPRF